MQIKCLRRVKNNFKSLIKLLSMLINKKMDQVFVIILNMPG